MEWKLYYRIARNQSRPPTRIKWYLLEKYAYAKEFREGITGKIVTMEEIEAKAVK